MADEPKPGTDIVKPVSDNEMEVAYSGPAYFTNKFYITATGVTARIAFTEQAPPNQEPQFRTAVAMTLADLIKLGELIQGMTANVQTVEVRVDPKVNSENG